MIVKDVMHKGIHLVSNDFSVKSVAKIMANFDIGTIMVGTPESLEGIFSERDLMLRVVAPGLSVENTSIGEVMTRKVLTVKETEDVDSVLTKMGKKRIRHLPVVNRSGTCVGMVGARDLMGAMVDKLENENKIMVDYILTVSRIAISIMDLAAENGIKEGNTIVINNKFSKSKFEYITDTSRKTLNKVMANFVDEGLITIEKDKLVILDKAKLENKII